MFSSSTKVKIEKDLYQRLAKIAQVGGYASTVEFIVHVLEREVSQIDQEKSDQDVEERLRGLGYIE